MFLSSLSMCQWETQYRWLASSIFETLKIKWITLNAELTQPDIYFRHQSNGIISQKSHETPPWSKPVRGQGLPEEWEKVVSILHCKRSSGACSVKWKNLPKELKMVWPAIIDTRKNGEWTLLIGVQRKVSRSTINSNGVSWRNWGKEAPTMTFHHLGQKFTVAASQHNLLTLTLNGPRWKWMRSMDARRSRECVYSPSPLRAIYSCSCDMNSYFQVGFSDTYLRKKKTILPEWHMLTD